MGMASEIKSLTFWRAVFTEFFGTTFFIYLLTTVLINLNPTTTGAASVMTIAFSIGLSISVLAQIFGPISGGHFNPAVTIGIFVKGEISILKTVLYTLAQLIGAILGSAFTYALTPSDRRGALGNLDISPEITTAQGLFVELLLTMLLVFAVLGSTSSDHGRRDFGYANGLAIGISITVAHLVGIPYTGAGINPARAFGPAVVMGDFNSTHWIYWLGPYLGGIIAAFLYRFIFGRELSESKQHSVTNGTTNGNVNGTFHVTTQH